VSSANADVKEARGLDEIGTADPRRVWAMLNQAQRNAAYDNNAAVSNSAELIEERNAASAALRTARPARLDLAYGRRERNCWDLFPAENPHAPCLVFLHGGYWQRNSRENFSMMAEGVMAHGWSAAIPGYSLAPQATLTDIVAEIDAALDWLQKEGAKHGIAGPVLLTGWSAGAQLAALKLSHPFVVAGIGLSGVYELGPIRDTWLNDALRLTDEEIETLSPLRLAPVMKPFHIAYGTEELPALINDARSLHAHRAAAQAPGYLMPICHRNHFSILDELRRADGELTRRAVTDHNLILAANNRVPKI
jgi:acetyl esterase/lipase